jgi:hypothetical protein
VLLGPRLPAGSGASDDDVLPTARRPRRRRGQRLAVEVVAEGGVEQEGGGERGAEEERGGRLHGRRRPDGEVSPRQASQHPSRAACLCEPARKVVVAAAKRRE